MGIPVEEDSFSHCTVYDKSGDPDRRAIPCNNWDYDEKKMNSTIVSRWNLDCHRR